LHSVYRAGGLAWLGYRLDMAGVGSPNLPRPTLIIFSFSLALGMPSGSGASQTKIMYKAFLSYSQMKDYLMVLTDNDLLRYILERHAFKTTKKVLGFLRPTIGSEI
jgi:predicted transcriptional regulator